MEDDKIEEDETIRSCDVIKVIIINKIVLIAQLLLTYFIFDKLCVSKLTKDSPIKEELFILGKIVGYVMIMIIVNMLIKTKMEVKRINSHTRLYYGLMCFCDIMSVSMLLMTVAIYQVKIYCKTISDSPDEPMMVLAIMSLFSIPFMLGEFILAYLICKLKRSETLEKLLEKK